MGASRLDSRDIEPTTDGDGVLPILDSARRVGRYHLCYELAAGGMASVYLARTDGPGSFDKLVALKRIHPHLEREEEFVRMFLDEARIASRISHPNVCAVFDVGVAEGSHYIAMEFVMGETLARLSRAISRRPDQMQSPWIPAYLARVVADACEGLHAAHELKGDRGEFLNVVHRDVSPQNIFVTYDGTVRLVDFGIARAAGRLHETRTGSVKGKLAYLAPEAIQKLVIDRRADIFALGIVLWELLTGQRLFRRDAELETILAIANEPILAPSQVRPGIPKELDAIVLRALERDRDKRYSTTREMGRDLNRFIAGYGEPVGMAEISEWMDDLFHDAKKRRTELVEKARVVISGPVERVPAALAGDTSNPSASVSRVVDKGTPKVVWKGPKGLAGWQAVVVIGLGAIIGLAATLLIGHSVRASRARSSLEVAGGPGVAVATNGTQTSTEGRTAEARSRPLVVPPAPTPTAVGSRTAAPTPVPVAPAPLPPTPSVAVTPTTPVPVAPNPLPTSNPVAGNPTTPVPVAANPLPATGTAETGTTGASTAVETGTDDPDPAIEPTGDVDTTEGASPTPRTQVRRVVRRPPRPATPRPTAGAQGTVNITTPGAWADIFVNGERVGRTPTQIRLPPGRQTIELRIFGESPGRRSVVTVPAGGSTRLVVRSQ